MLLRGRLSMAQYVAYVVIPGLAGVLAGLLVRALDYAPHGALAVAGSGEVLVVEFLFTFALVWVVVNVTTARETENNSFYGLAIGFTVAAGAFAVRSVSGGVFNPAIALGGSVLGVVPVGPPRELPARRVRRWSLRSGWVLAHRG
jgi:aquaporin Z